MQSLRTVLKIAATLAGVGLGSPLAAQDEAPQPWYAVEVIIFAQPGSADLGRPLNRADPKIDAAAEPVAQPEPPAEHIYSLLRPIEPEQAIKPFSLVPADEWQLMAAWERLQRHREYRPLVHLAWRQPEYPFGGGKPVRLHGGKILAGRSEEPSSLVTLPDHRAKREPVVEEIDGNIVLTKGRYLHIALDLAYRQPEDRGTSTVVPWSLARRDRRFWTYRIQQKRRVQLNELAYFDHQAFGVLAKVTTFEIAFPESDPLLPLPPTGE